MNFTGPKIGVHLQIDDYTALYKTYIHCYLNVWKHFEKFEKNEHFYSSRMP